MHAVASTTDNWCWVSLSESLSDEIIISLKSLIKSPSKFVQGTYVDSEDLFKKIIGQQTVNHCANRQKHMFMRG